MANDLTNIAVVVEVDYSSCAAALSGLENVSYL